ncbi:YeeE/YedE family protein [beta proteobacterium MWH-UniP1]
MLANFIEQYGEGLVLAAGGAVIGMLFGFFAQRSRFCLRAAVIEFWQRRFGEKLSIWLLAFSSAVIAVQVMAMTGWLDTSSARQISATGSLSGALVGGVVFGVGMILTRGCASRLLVLSANGNLRALLSGLIFAVTAQASLAGALSPLRTEISSWWTIDGGPSRDMLAQLGVGHMGGLVMGLIWAVAALYFVRRSATRSRWMWIGGIGTGLMVAAAWGFSQLVAKNSFEPIQIQGLTFSGPSAEWLMRVLSQPAPKIGFEFGMLPGVFLGSLIGAAIGGDLKLEGFGGAYTMPRYILGAIFMGFGSMLAGGCAVGAGVTGGAIFALTAWLSLLGMWLGAGIADRLVDSRENGAP